MIGISNHPWMSGLFADEEMAALFAPKTELARFLQIEAAWTRALGAIANDPQAETAAQAIETAKIAPEDLRDGFARDGVAIPALVKLLKSKLGPDHAHWVHNGLTSQDVTDTATVLALSKALGLLSDRLAALDHALAAIQTRFGTSPVMAFTRMQPALETTAADVVARWRQPLPRLINDCAHVAQELAVIQWGGPIGVRDHPEATQLGLIFADNLNVKDPGHAWHTDRTIISDAVHVMVRITTATGKIGQDIALMAALGPEQISLVGGTSSAMPHKNNPVKAETLITLADYAVTMQANLTRSGRHEGFRSGQAWALEWLSLPQLSLVAGMATRLSNAALADVKGMGQGTAS